MAREQRKDVDYFPHDCTHGRKMHIIEAKYGNDGYAVWFKLLEQLGKANNHYIDASDEMTIMFLTSLFKIDEDKMNNIFKDLAKLGAIDKELYEQHNILWSLKFVNSISDAYRKRKLLLFKKEDILKEMNQFEVIPPSISGGLNHKEDGFTEISVIPPEVIPKEKNSIVKESKEEEKKEENKKVVFNFRKKLFEYGFKENLINDWMLIRKKKNSTDTETTFNKFIREIELAPEDKNDILLFIVEKEWKSFEYQWLINLQSEFKKQQERNNGNKFSPNQQTIDERYEDINNTVDKYFVKKE